jgi:hypothetical protein
MQNAKWHGNVDVAVRLRISHSKPKKLAWSSSGSSMNRCGQAASTGHSRKESDNAFRQKMPA